ncbi:class I SAM-dependent methyltransferase [Parahaliea mediterranea]|uniref:class I SAM-dependent methyltransferase n=1 Tax=Parahaliea mediterranea TaxID=651086 RepID=UPI000E2F1E7F|nr:50S ribosomal protein L11 methyltransferase [Parahaliea mediterranea]
MNAPSSPALTATLSTLQARLQRVVPGATLEAVTLPVREPLQLHLLNADYPQGELDAEAVRFIMENPLYWVFCWASGLVLADWLFEQPQWVYGKRVVDFGCGSGVAAIAAAMAGAREVIACDIDPDALSATAANAALNGFELSLSADFHQIDGAIDLLIVADVLYDRANFPWLQTFIQRADRVLLADSRVKDFDFPGYRQIARREAHTLPDLDESSEFRDVRVYEGRAG